MNDLTPSHHADKPKSWLKIEADALCDDDPIKKPVDGVSMTNAFWEGSLMPDIPLSHPKFQHQ